MLPFELHLAAKRPPQNDHENDQEHSEERTLGDHHDDPPAVVLEQPIPNLPVRSDDPPLRIAGKEKRRPQIAVVRRRCELEPLRQRWRLLKTDDRDVLGPGLRPAFEQRTLEVETLPRLTG